MSSRRGSKNPEPGPRPRPTAHLSEDELIRRSKKAEADVADELDLRASSFVIADDRLMAPAPLPPPRFKSRKEREDYRKENNLCIQCGKKLSVNNLSFRCYRCKKKTSRATKRWRKRNKDKVAKQKAWLKADRKANPAKYALMQRRIYREHARKKLCTDCTEPALEGGTRCELHRDKNRKKAMKYYKKVGRKKRRAAQREAAKLRRAERRLKQRLIEQIKSDIKKARARHRRLRHPPKRKQVLWDAKNKRERKARKS